MAIKVNGTTVIDDSRNFTNIAGGFKTVNGTSVVGSGNISAGASTTQGAVGTYMHARYIITPSGGSAAGWGDTRAGSTLNPAGYTDQNNTLTNAFGSVSSVAGSNLQSGTWRLMGDNRGGYGYYYAQSLWVRIS